MIQRILSHQISAFQSLPPKDIPLYLDVQGQNQNTIQAVLDTLPSRGLAIVGTRYPQRRSVELMEQAFDSLSGQDLVIISGFARGIDSRAHELALNHGLKTVAVLGCGIEVDYPRENRHLKKRILEQGGLIISEFEPKTAAFAGNFLQRNRLIAALSKATWVVEGAAVSGTLNTASWAMRYDRDLYATPCFPGDSFYQGNEKLLSHSDPGSVPMARPFFGVKSLSDTWKEMTDKPQQSLPLQLKSEIQKWVAELKSQHGTCHVQTLMNLAFQKGLTPGKFYLQLEDEIQQGLVHHHPDGSVTLEP